MNQICGITDCYFQSQVSGPITFQRLVAPKFGLPVDEARVAAAIPQATVCVGEIGRRLGEQKYLAGGDISIADLMLAPQMDYFAQIAEGAGILQPHSNLVAWLERMRARPSMIATTWDRMTELAKAA